MQTIPALEHTCQELGFHLLGIVAALDPQDGTDCQIALIGHVGKAFWPLFTVSPEYHDGLPDRLDRYCRRVLSQNKPTSARLIMPNDRPYAPFQHWAKNLGNMHPSPLGMLIHQEYGLWSAFRGAWCFPTNTFTLLTTPEHTAAPCATCSDKPCLSTCPVTAFTEDGFAAETCRDYLCDTPNPCIAHQCQARLACPIGAQYRYSPETGAFFLKNFARLA